jgi:hypothetical protein
VDWAYIWDTETYNGGAPAKEVVIQISVKDMKGGTTTTMSDEVDIDGENAVKLSTGRPASFHNKLTVDIVPYVTGFERQTGFATTRSRQGWYSFYQGETGITINGFNLGTGNLTVTLDYATSNGTTITTPDPAPLSATLRTFSMVRTSGTGALESGRINVLVGGTDGTPIHNHVSSNENKSWNNEYNAYTAGSDLWINKPHAHIWRTTNDATAPRTYFNGSDGPSTPGMALEYGTGNPGRLHAAWTSFGDATYYYGYNGDANPVPMQAVPAGDPFSETDISIHNGSISGTGNAPNIAAVYQNDGSPLLYCGQL